MKDLAGLLNQLSPNTLKFQLIDHYVKLPVQLRRLRKGLINIKNKDQKCFLWYQVRHINPVKVHQEKTTRGDLNFLRKKKIFCFRSKI